VAPVAACHADLVVAVSLHGPRTRNAAASPARESADRRPAAEWWDHFRASAAEVLSSDMVAALAPRRTSRRPGATPSQQVGDTDSGSLPSIGMLEVLKLSLDASQSALTRYSLAAHPTS
jgi:NTE family protein